MSQTHDEWATTVDPYDVLDNPEAEGRTVVVTVVTVGRFLVVGNADNFEVAPVVVDLSVEKTDDEGFEYSVDDHIAEAVPAYLREAERIAQRDAAAWEHEQSWLAARRFEL